MSSGIFNTNPCDVPIINSKYRRIVTKIPVPESIEIMDSIHKYESRSMHGQMPIIWDRAEGFQVYDSWGNMWLDFTSTIFVTNSGHGNDSVVSSLQDTLNKPLLHAYNYYTHERANYIQYLIENTPEYFEKVFMLSAGTEATECALKLMRMHGRTINNKKLGIIAFEGNWHGRTLGAQMMGYNKQQKEWIGYQDPNIYHLPFPFPWVDAATLYPESYFYDCIEKLIDDHNISPKEDLCGFMIETYQGWGALFYPPAFIKALESFARQHNILITFDEMQAGFGRTGKLFGYMHYDVTPDLICCGKGASSSLPLSFVLGKKELLDLPDVGSMSSTHSANPMVCAAGLANLKYILENNLIENSNVLGEFFINELNKIKQTYPNHIDFIAGKGLLAAMHFNDPSGKPLSELCTAICEKLMQRGLLVVHTGRESIKLAPPLTITKDALTDGLNLINETIQDCINES